MKAAAASEPTVPFFQRSGPTAEVDDWPVNFECTMSRDALEQHFWLQSGASETRVLKAFEDGRRRIMAVAARKALAHGGERIVLSVADFDAGA